MKTRCADIFFSYSHFCDKELFGFLIERAEKNVPDARAKIEMLQQLFFELNRYIKMEDVVGKLMELEGYAEAMEAALRAMGEEARGLQTLNERNRQAIRELFVMLDSKELG